MSMCCLFTHGEGWLAKSQNKTRWLRMIFSRIYRSARRDPRFLEAFRELESTLADGQIVVRRVVPKLAGLAFCKKGQPSELAPVAV